MNEFFVFIKYLTPPWGFKQDCESKVGPAGPPPPPGVSDTAVASLVRCLPPRKFTPTSTRQVSQPLTAQEWVVWAGPSGSQTLGQLGLDTKVADYCSVSKSCPTLYNPMDCSMPGCPALHCLLEFAQTHVHWVDDVIQPSHLLSDPISSCIQSFLASGSFSVSQLFMSGDQNTGA